MQQQKQAEESRRREQALCGPECLAELLHRQGKAADVHALANEMKTGADGTTLQSLADAAQTARFRAEGIGADAERIGKAEPAAHRFAARRSLCGGADSCGGRRDGVEPGRQRDRQSGREDLHGGGVAAGVDRDGAGPQPLTPSPKKALGEGERMDNSDKDCTIVPGISK